MALSAEAFLLDFSLVKDQLDKLSPEPGTGCEATSGWCKESNGGRYCFLIANMLP